MHTRVKASAENKIETTKQLRRGLMPCCPDGKLKCKSWNATVGNAKVGKNKSANLFPKRLDRSMRNPSMQRKPSKRIDKNVETLANEGRESKGSEIQC